MLLDKPVCDFGLKVADFTLADPNGALQYRCRLDDVGTRDGAGRVRELFEVMTQTAVTRQGPRAQFSSMGCSIKWT